MVKPITIIIYIITLSGYLAGCKGSSTVHENTGTLTYENFTSEELMPVSIINKSPALGIIQEIKLSDTARLVSDGELTPAEEAFVYDFDIINGWREDMKSNTVITKDQGPVILTETRDNWIKNVQSTSKVKLLASIENEGIRLLLVLLKQDISLYNHSSRIYAFGIVNSEVKSIVRVAEPSAYEDSYIKSFTILDEGSFTYNEEYKNSPSASVVYKYSKEGHITPL